MPVILYSSFVFCRPGGERAGMSGTKELPHFDCHVDFAEFLYESLTGIFEDNDFTSYQYVDWNEEKGINGWFLCD